MFLHVDDWHLLLTMLSLCRNHIHMLHHAQLHQPQQHTSILPEDRTPCPYELKFQPLSIGVYLNRSVWFDPQARVDDQANGVCDLLQHWLNFPHIDLH